MAVLRPYFFCLGMGLWRILCEVREEISSTASFYMSENALFVEYFALFLHQ